MKQLLSSGAVGALIVAGITGPFFTANAEDPPSSSLVVDGPALLREWTPPVYPEEARKAKKEGRVEVDVIVDEHGAVTEAQVAESTDPVFDAAALEAVRRWKFEPATDASNPVACGMHTPVVFSLAQPKHRNTAALPPQELWPERAKTDPARVLNAPDPDYPDEIAARKLPGRVDLELNLDAGGRVVSRRVVFASDGVFVAEALRVSALWTFEPAHEGLLAKPAKMGAPVTFASLGAKSREICEANGLRFADGTDVDGWPEPVMMPEPVFPRERLLAGDSGSARASFTIDGHGGVTDFEPGDCSAPEFGAALRAAVDLWVFRPASKDGSGVPVHVTVRHDFHQPEGDSLAQLVAGVKGDGIKSAKGLDAPLEIMWRGYPVYPSALRDSNPAGDAQIEFVIDRDGRARLPRVVSATMPEFGWAAATAVSQWVFAPPRRGGEPTEVLVRVPLRFSPKG